MKKAFLILLAAAALAVLARMAAAWLRTDAERVRLVIEEVLHCARQRQYLGILRHVSGARYRDEFHENKNMLMANLHFLSTQCKAVSLEVLEGPDIEADGQAGKATARLRAKVLLGHSPDAAPTENWIGQARGTDLWLLSFIKEEGVWYITGATGPEEKGSRRR